MSYEISKFPFKAELASASFNAKFEEIETYINNLSSEVETLRTENQELRQLLNNKIEYFDNTTNIRELTEKVKNPICVRPYIMTINEPVRQALGIPSTTGMYWGNIICLPNPNGSGYASQIFCSMVSGTILKRFAHAHNWGSWT